MLRDNIYIHPPSFLFLCLWECDISIEGRRPGHRTEYSAHVFNVKTSPAGSCSIFPQSTWALCPKRWDFLCIRVTGCSPSNSPSTAFHHHEYSEWRIIDAILFVASLSLQPLGLFVAGAKQVFTGQTLTKNASTDVIIFQQRQMEAHWRAWRCYQRFQVWHNHLYNISSLTI